MIYSDGSILRVYHARTINAADAISPLECPYSINVDFFHMDYELYIEADHPLVDISKGIAST
jgi:hypothetical protein